MSWLTRYAVAVFHLGPRQAARNLLQRVGPRKWRPARYARATGALEWRGRAAAPFLGHDAATRLADGRFTAVGRTLEVGVPPRWNIEAPLLWQFNLHYFAFLRSLAPSEQGRLILDWIERCPPRPAHLGWRAYPISLRLRHWVQWLFGAGSGQLSAADRARVLASIEGQGECLADSLERHLRGNHLFENALTLKFLAACFRGPSVARWDRLGSRTLVEELAEQFLPDGGHLERSPMYHAQLTGGLLDLVNVLPETDPQRKLVLERLPDLLRFVTAVRHPDGQIALLNDAAFEIAPPPAALLDYATRLGMDPRTTGRGMFADTGYYTWHAGGDALIVDAGPIGPDYLPGHGHGDMFSYELSLDGRRVVVDGGTSTYEAGPERDWVRSTRAHNTVEIAGQDQCEFFAAFRVGRRGRPRNVTAEVSADGLHISGWHDGYRRLGGRPVHHREIELTAPRTLLVWDTVESTVPQAAVSRVRFAPGARVSVDSPQRASVEIDGTKLVLRAFGGELSLEPGEYAPRFGERLPCSVLALRKGPAPEFGYALAPCGIPVTIEAIGAEVAGRMVARRARRSEGEA